LRDQLHALAQRAGVSVSKILVMDASRRSSHGNAYFAGIGSSRRIVLYDTLLQQLSHDEIAAVLAHEIGHMKHHHILKGFIFSGVTQLLGFFITALVLAWPSFYTAFGFNPPWGVGGAFFVLMYISGLFSFWLTPFISSWYRSHEYQADATAASLMGSPQPLITGLQKMTTQSLASIEDHPLSQAFYAAHPTLQQRQERLLKDFPAI
jgi:STE24 endopeptidase